MSNRRNYEKHKHSKGKFCLVCLLRRGEYVPVTNVSKMWCCVVCAKVVTWWHKKNKAQSDAAKAEGPRALRELQLSREFLALVDEVMETGRMPTRY